MTEAADQLRRKADEWRSLGEEYTSPDDPARLFYTAVEVSLRETADALDAAVREAA